MSGEAAWTFAQRLYAHPGLSAVLLRLQDDHRVDVPLVLVLLHAAALRQLLDAAVVDDLAQRSGEWQRSVVGPLRQLRRSLGCRADRRADGLYEQAKALELSAEEAIIRRLGEALPGGVLTAPEAAAIANLESYRDLLGLPEGRFDAVLTAFAASAAAR